MTDHTPTAWGPWARCATCGISHLDSPLDEDRHCAPCVRAMTSAIRDELASNPRREGWGASPSQPVGDSPCGDP